MEFENSYSREAEMTATPIPEVPPVSGWKEVPIVPNYEGLVPVGPFSKYWDIFTDSIYFGERETSPYKVGQLQGALLTQFVRKDLADSLRVAQVNLPRGMYLIVFDAFRPLSVQQSLYDTFYTKLKGQNPDWTPEQLSTEAQKFVSLPSEDPTKPSPHNTGGSVDLGIFKIDPNVLDKFILLSKMIDPSSSDWKLQYALEMERLDMIAKYGRLLNFGTEFDYGGQAAGLRKYEEMTDGVIAREIKAIREGLESRRILYHVMTDAGFQPYPDEWWHFNSPKSQMGAKTAGLEFAEYGSAEGLVNEKHELMRQMHRGGTILMKEGRHPGAPEALREHFRIANDLAQVVGDLRDIRMPEVSVITPPSDAEAYTFKYWDLR